MLIVDDERVGLRVEHTDALGERLGRELERAPAHNFRLEKNAGTVVLTASNGVTIVDIVSFPELDTGLAYGRDLDGNWTFLEPTPSAVNAAPTYLGWLKELENQELRHAADNGTTPYDMGWMWRELGVETER